MGGSQVGLARYRVTHTEQVLARIDVIEAHQLGIDHPIDRRAGSQVECVYRLDGRKPGGLQPKHGGPLFSVQQLEFCELHQTGGVDGVVSCCLVGLLLALGPDGRVPESLQVVSQEY